MFAYSLRTAALAAAAAIGLSGCGYNGLYSGLSVGYGNAGYYDPYYGYGYGYPRYGYSRLGHRYGFDPYWGWYDDFYYPGTGLYVYDVYRRPYRWTDAQRRYWTIRRERALAANTQSRPVVIRDNWDDFRRDRSAARSNRIDRQVNRARIERELSRPERIEHSSRPVRVERSVARAEKSAAREQRQSAREQRRSEIRAERASRGNGRIKEKSRQE